MTNEANNSSVSRAYRDLANETTRDELDDRVLKMAAQEARPRYGIARAWTRPVAWAAMIGLSLVIVMQVNQTGFEVAVDEQQPEALAVPAADAVPGRSSPEQPSARTESLDERVAPDNGAAHMRQQTSRRKDAGDQPAVANAAAPEPAISAGGSMPVETDADQLAEIVVSGAKQEAREVRQYDPNGASAFKASDLSLLDDAEEQARLRSGEVSVSAFAGVAAEATPPDCEAAAIATAEGWYDCVLQLRELGLDDAADRQLEALLEEYPEFEEPATNK